MADAVAPGPPYSPYGVRETDALYNLLFCDDLASFLPAAGERAAPWQALLAAPSPDTAALASLAADPALDGRVRFLACAKLRDHGRPVPARLLLGVIVEVPLDAGLDALAAFTDGGVRYLNASGRAVVLEGVADVRPAVDALLAASQPVLARIGPWTAPRRPPPAPGNLRLSFLAAEGLCLGEGSGEALQQDALAAPVIAAATTLLRAVVAIARGKRPG